MKKDIHPENHEVVAECACGQTITTVSTSPTVKVTLCSSCHPFFTGKQKFVDTAGRIDRFKKRFEKAAAAQAEQKAPEKEKKSKKSSQKK